MGNKFLQWLFMREPTLMDKKKVPELMTKVFKKLDVSNDNRISRTEFSDSQPTFESFDTDKDGYIDKTELYGEDRKKICITLLNRSNYGRLKPVIQKLQEYEEIELQIVCGGSMLIDKYGTPINQIKQDGFIIDEEVAIELEGSTLETMAKSTGLTIIDLASAYKRLNPDFVLLIGDRYETLGAAIASSYQNICTIHLQGGEVTGSIDESIRHAITKLSHYHFPATKKAAKNIIAMGEHPDTVFHCGCPSVDAILELEDGLISENIYSQGVGWPFDLSKPYFLVIFHPITTEFKHLANQTEQILLSLSGFWGSECSQTIIFWPNIDAGADIIAEQIRIWREMDYLPRPHVFKNLGLGDFIPLLKKATVAIGNSSSLIRDASFLGTPVVLIGTRQDGREHTQAVLKVKPEHNEIREAVKKQMKHGRYERSELYGTFGASQKIVNKILELKPYSQKRLQYE